MFKNGKSLIKIGTMGIEKYYVAVINATVQQDRIRLRFILKTSVRLEQEVAPR